MSNGNAQSKHSLEFSTATVGIFSPTMKETLLVCNNRIGALVPPGGKWKPTDVNMCHAGLRELWEEVGIDLPVTPGDWLDIHGEIVDYQKIVREYPFYIGTQAMVDYLFLYRLHSKSSAVYASEKEGRWYSKKDLQPETIVLDGKVYRVLVPGTREAVLALLK